MAHTHIASFNVVQATPLGEAPSIAPNAIIKNCSFGRYTEVGEQARLTDSVLDDYSYLERGCDVMSTDIGKFSNIAAMVRINPGFHPMERPTLHHFTYPQWFAAGGGWIEAGSRRMSAPISSRKVRSVATTSPTVPLSWL